MTATDTCDFLKLFYQDEEEICFRTFPPRGVDGRTNKHRGSINELQNGTGLHAKLARWNQKNGIYFVVNFGGDSDSDITRFNACFVESDSRTIEEQHQKLDASPLPTTARIQTARSVHGYFKLHGTVPTEACMTLRTA